MSRLVLQTIFAIGVLAAQPLVAQRRARAALPLDFAASASRKP